jgi:sugar-specific transcriptional regulator TrmB
MDDRTERRQAIELLQQLGLKEYEARSFVALARQDRGTAKEISEASEVPRTRVYDAVRVLESKGLVETQHSNPQTFRAVPVDEAVGTIRSEYEGRTDRLREALEALEPVADGEESDVTHEVWALSGEAGVAGRARRLLDDAELEVVLVLGSESVFTDELTERLSAAVGRGVDVLVGTVTEELRERVRSALPDVEVFVSELAWLGPSELLGDDTEISRLMLVDREALLVSSFTRTEDGRTDEYGVFGRGFDNGVVAIARRLMATGLLPGRTEAFDDRSASGGDE